MSPVASNSFLPPAGTAAAFEHIEVSIWPLAQVAQKWKPVLRKEMLKEILERIPDSVKSGYPLAP